MAEDKGEGALAPFNGETESRCLVWVALGFHLPPKMPQMASVSPEAGASQTAVRMAVSLTWGSVPFTSAGMSALE